VQVKAGLLLPRSLAAAVLAACLLAGAAAAGEGSRWGRGYVPNRVASDKCLSSGGLQCRAHETADAHLQSHEFRPIIEFPADGKGAS